MTCQLYRHFDKNDKLLYVGISECGLTRIKQHKRSSWYHLVTKITIEHLASREEAELMERAAIAKECPIYNVRRIKHTNPMKRANRMSGAMTYENIVKHFKSQAEAARSLGIPQTTISAWATRPIPYSRQVHIQYATGGKLKARN